MQHAVFTCFQFDAMHYRLLGVGWDFAADRPLHLYSTCQACRNKSFSSPWRSADTLLKELNMVFAIILGKMPGLKPVYDCKREL